MRLKAVTFTLCSAEFLFAGQFNRTEAPRIRRELQARSSVSRQVNTRPAAMPAPRLNILLYDLANISPHTLDEAARQATRVLATAGVEVVWQLGPADSPEAHANDQTATTAAWRQTPDTRDYVVVRIVAGLPARTLPDALGYSLPDTKRGVHATVFYDRIAPLGQSGAIGVSALLGHVMAHEIGHVLLGTTEHSLDGIMKARWGRPDYQRAAMGLLGLTRAQRAAIRERPLRGSRQCAPPGCIAVAAGDVAVPGK